MKKLLVTFFLFASVSLMYSQTETGGTPDSLNISTFKTINMNAFGDFLIDMNLFEPVKLPKFDFDNIYGNQDYLLNFSLDPKITYSVGTIGNNFGYSGFFHGFFSGVETVQTATFKINDNIRLKTYGHYNSDGYKVINYGGHPWNKKDFVGGMELKVNNNFGFRMEVRRQHTPFFP